MEWSDVGKLIQATAPILGNILVDSIPGSSAVKAAASLVASAFGVADTPDAIDAVLKADPNNVLKLREVESNNQVSLAQIQASLVSAQIQAQTLADKAAYDDVASARSRDIAIIQAGRTNERASWLVAGDVIGLVVCLAILFFYKGELSGTFTTLLTTFGTVFGLGLRDAHQFEFGGSRSSIKKDETLASLAAQPTNVIQMPDRKAA